MSQALTIIGLFFEALSIVYTARGVFPPSKSDKERKNRHYEKIMKYATLGKQLKHEEDKFQVVLLLLLIGLGLQGAAEFL